MKRMVAAALTVGGLVCVAVVAGILSLMKGDDADPAGAVPRKWSVETARQFEDHAVYWLGESFQGLPLTGVSRMDFDGGAPGKPWNHPWHEVSFTYGDCEIAAGEESCALPLSIHVRPYCEVPPEAVAEGAKAGAPEVLRGAAVQRLTSGTLQMWTRDVTINIAATDEGLLIPAVRNLVRLNGDGEPSTAQEQLGPPDKIDCPPQSGMMP